MPELNRYNMNVRASRGEIDPTGQAHPAILITGPRTGGTFLCCCLSNHSQIFCTRGEPFHWGSRWRHIVPDWKARMDLLMRQPFYTVSMFKAIDHSIFGFPEVWEFLQRYDPALKILYLERQDVLAQAISCAINVLHRRGELPTHPTRTFVPVSPKSCELEPGLVRRQYQRIKRRVVRNRACLAAGEVPVLYLDYTVVTMMDAVLSSQICEFLGVRDELLHTDLKKVHARSYREFVTNWPEIKELCNHEPLA